MTTEGTVDESADILRVVNAATTPTDLAEALAGSADPTAGIKAARMLLTRREATGRFRSLSEISDVLDQHGPARLDEVAPALANLAQHVGTRVVGLVDPEFAFAELGRADGGVVRRRSAELSVDPGVRTAGPVSYDAFVVELGLPGPSGFLSWVGEALTNSSARRAGEIQITDGSFRPMHVREFESAVMAEVTFPACDAASKDPAAIKARFLPHAIRQRTVDRTPLDVSTQASEWRSSNFSVSIDPLPTSKVARVESFSWTNTIAEDGSTLAEVPSIKLTIGWADFDAWQNWALQTIQGNYEEAEGSITYLNADLNEELGRVELSGLVPISLEPGSNDANDDRFPRFIVELSCHGLRFIEPSSSKPPIA